MRPCAGSPFPGALALLATCSAACTATPAPPPPAPVTVVALPAPASPDAAAAPVTPAAPEAKEAPESAQSFGTSKSAGIDTPMFTAKFAAVFRRTPKAPSALPDPLAGDAVLLFAMAVRCEEAIAASESDRVRVSVPWRAGGRVSFMHVSISNGEGRRHAGTIDVLDAPSIKGARGRLRVDPGETGNVDGGTIEALVCD